MKDINYREIFNDYPEAKIGVSKILDIEILKLQKRINNIEDTIRIEKSNRSKNQLANYIISQFNYEQRIFEEKREKNLRKLKQSLSGVCRLKEIINKK